MQKARGQASRWRSHRKALPLLVSTRFQVLFHSPHRGSFHLSLTVLVHYRSQAEYLALEDGPPRFPRDFTCPAVLGNCSPEKTGSISPTGLSPSMVVLSRSLRLHSGFVTSPGYPQRQPHNPGLYCYTRFGLFPVRSPLLRESRLISFPRGTEMFHFPPFASARLCIQRTDDAALPAPGFPIRKSPDQSLLSGSPKLIAASHVLHRLLAPRHPPYALSSLTTNRRYYQSALSQIRITRMQLSKTEPTNPRMRLDPHAIPSTLMPASRIQHCSHEWS